MSENQIKYNLILELVNKFLINMNKSEITDLIEFKDIDREIINNDKNKNIICEMESNIYKYFNKKDCGFYRKSADGFVINCIRGMTKEIGYTVSTKRKTKSKIIDNKSYQSLFPFYSIIKNI
jgi:hypothetical protein